MARAYFLFMYMARSDTAFLSDIARRHTSEIKFNHTQDKTFFTVTGSNSIQQKQALDELAILLVDRTPHSNLLPRIPFPDARPNAARPNVVDPNFNHPSELLIDFSEDANDTPAATQQPSQAPPVVTETFVVDNLIQDPNKMFYPTKRQKTDLPEIIASSRNCTSVISNNSRHLVAVKVSYDSAAGDWLPDPGALTILNLAANGRSNSRQGSARSPQGAGRGSLDDQSWGPAPTGGTTEWYDQDSDGFGFGDENDFPSLGPGQSAKAPKNRGIPQLPSMRKPGESSWSSSPVSDSPSPKAIESLVFDDKAFEFLEKRSSSPKVNNNTDLAFPRSPGQDRDTRTLRVLPSLQSDASQDVNSFINNMRSYNMRRLTQAMWAGLEELRGHRKEIRLFARLGKVLYKGPLSVCGQTWDHEQLETTVIRNLGVIPLFSPIATTSSSSVENMFGFLGQPAVESAEFAVVCDTRTNPQSRYVRTLVTVPPTVAILDRVVTPWETYAEVSWNSMDKNTDFDILLQAREGVIHDVHSALGRTDVKPFGAFRKSLSIGTHNKHISCRELPNYLEIRSINYKETRKYTFEDNADLTVLVHNVQELELTRIKETGTVTGRTYGAGKAWYEIEVYNDNLNRHFRSNLTLSEGLTADWTAKDILGSPTNSDELSKMVKNTMLVVDQCQARFKE
ncbi:hypothetical protein BG000_009283 [Podila horticola]|nr:hypothetical protein BG000_009283 [Podila horticola]